MRTTDAIRTGLLVLALLGLSGCGGVDESHGHDEAEHTEAHDHDADPDGHTGDEHAGDDHAAGDEHDEHGEEVVRLSPAQLAEAGVVIEPLAGGVITTHVTLPAEVGLNQDTVLHITPRVPGIVTEVRAFLGESVEAGAVMAVLESPELGEAKIEYLQAIQARESADAELARQKTISTNTAALLELLKGEPDMEEVRTGASGLRIGENKGRLISAYAKLHAARANYARERDLRAKGLSTEADLLAAQEAFNSSQADYLAAFEDIDFTHHLRLQESERAAGVAASAMENAERRLHLLGLSDEQVAGISAEPDVDIARYELRSPGEGRVVVKHIAPGEKVDDEEPVYTVANLDTVWLNISVYTEYAGMIREGQSVVVHAGQRSAMGVVDYVSAVVSESTRTVSARVVVQNQDYAWKPGEFVTARVETGDTSVARVVPIEAIQTFEGHEVIFVQTEEGIEPVPVRLGRRNDVTVEVLGDEI
ncbi:MAG: efflux RND transporter periplasmic adaptor subunit, partial [Halioglobus sp.]|nr:efflux RND transporter periplasmic adaptor subunit [Halioglobus sp.]